MPYSIKLKEISYSVDDNKILDNINLFFDNGSFTIIDGKSGSGKTTLLEIMAGIRKPDSGYVYWDDKPFIKLGYAEKIRHRRKMGYVFQNTALISNMTVFDNIALPVNYHYTLSKELLHISVTQHLKKFEILHLKDRLPETLSYGEKKMVEIARALIMRPDFLILDEPLSGLDGETALKAMEIVKSIKEISSTTIVIAGYAERLSYYIDFDKYQIDIINLNKRNEL